MRWDITVVLLCNLMDFFAFSVPLSYLPQLLNAEKLGATFYGGFQALSNGIGLLASFVLGRISDKHGRKPVFLLCVSLGFCAYVCYISSTLATENGVVFAVVGDVLRRCNRNGIGGVITALIADLSSKTDRAVYMGRSVSAQGMGFGLGSVVGGVLGDWGIIVPLTTGCIVVGINLIVATLWLPKTDTGRPTGNNKETTEANTAALTMELLGDKQIRTLLCARGLLSIGFFTVISTMALFCRQRFGFSPKEYGITMAVIGALFSICNVTVVPLILPHFTEKRAVQVGMCITSCGRLGLALAHNMVTFWIAEVLIAIGSAMTVATYSAFLSKRAPKGSTGHLMGMSESINGMAAVLAPLPSGYLYEHYGTSVPGVISAVTSLLAAIVIGLAEPPPQSPKKKL
eukprot:TRINITY_DN61399_c1_g2_i1.p1 TRINITY_DN61399_c1_g2~~TRINITY_DN61399_c1_g2_i1.p1  ORF type:complete len:421 (-),score=5.69 TRINITY_DN61399_c1_g2_i1:120-1322(-)